MADPSSATMAAVTQVINADSVATFGALFIAPLFVGQWLVIVAKLTRKRLKICLHLAHQPGNLFAGIVDYSLGWTFESPCHVTKLNTRFNQIPHFIAVGLHRFVCRDQNPCSCHSIIDVLKVLENICHEGRGILALPLNCCYVVQQNLQHSSQEPDKEKGNRPRIERLSKICVIKTGRR
jgi:hypothetical protein